MHHSPSWFILSSKVTADIRYEALIPAVILTALAIFMVVLRWYSRVYSTSGSIGIEDYFVPAALLLSMGITAAVGGEFAVDGGRIKDAGLRHSVLSIMMESVFAQSIMYHVSINLVKASFAFQYIRLFFLIPSIVGACYILLILIFGAATWGIFGVIFLCDPVQMYWDVKVSGTCMDAEKHFWSTSIIGIVLDCAIWILPIPVIRSLKLPRRQKMGLFFVFSLGGFVCIVSVLRLVLVHHAAHRKEVTKSGTYAITFSIIEVNVAIICASLLVMKPLFARLVPAIVSEQPLSAREDRRMRTGSTRLDLLDGVNVDDVEKSEDDGRRDTVVGMDGIPAHMSTREEVWDPRRGLGSHV